MFKKYILAVSVILLAFSAQLFAGDKLKAEELIAKHLESIGTPEARAAVKNRVLKGDFQYTMQVGSPGMGADVHAHAKAAKGQAQLISMGQSLNYLLVSEEPGYMGERFYYNGKRPAIAMQGQQSRSIMGDFLEREDFILREGLFGGVLGTNWPLLDIAARSPKMRYEGLKKIDDKNVHVLLYLPKKSDTNLTIKLYFDAETFRHVRTTYEWKEALQMVDRTQGTGEMSGGNQNRSARRMTFQEDFSDFETLDGITIPQTWVMRYSQEPIPGVVRVDVKLTQAVHNMDAPRTDFFPYE